MFAVNQGAVNGGANIVQGQSGLLSGITIGGFSLCNENAGITAIYNNRSYDNKFYDNQFIDGKRLISHLIKDKEMSIDFAIKASTNDELQGKIDEFKAKTSGEKNGWVLFTIGVAGELRALRVIVVDTRFNTDGLVTTVQSGTITFVAVDPPRFYSYQPTTKNYLNISSNFTGQITNSGNAKTYPVYYVIFNSATSVTGFTLTINGYPLTITQAISAGDVITIATDPYGLVNTAGVFHNTTAIDFDGQLTTALNSQYAGYNTIEREGTGTYDCDITIIYHQMWE